VVRRGGPCCEAGWRLFFENRVEGCFFGRLPGGFAGRLARGFLNCFGFALRAAARAWSRRGLGGVVSYVDAIRIFSHGEFDPGSE